MLSSIHHKLVDLSVSWNQILGGTYYDRIKIRWSGQDLEALRTLQIEGVHQNHFDHRTKKYVNCIVTKMEVFTYKIHDMMKGETEEYVTSCHTNFCRNASSSSIMAPTQSEQGITKTLSGTNAAFNDKV